MTHFFRFTEFIIAIMKSLDFGWLWHVNVGSVATTNVPFWLGMLIIWEAMTMWGQGVYWKSLFFHLNFAVNPKLLGKKAFYSYLKYYIFYFSNTFWNEAVGIFYDYAYIHAHIDTSVSLFPKIKSKHLSVVIKDLHNPALLNIVFHYSAI